MKLTTKQIEAARPRDKEYLVGDGNGLFLRVRPDNTKSWLFKYTPPGGGNQRKLGLGLFPQVSLSAARTLANDKRLLLASDKDPHIEKLERRKDLQKRAYDNFEKVARAWHKHAAGVHEWSASYSEKILRRIELHALPKLGKMPLNLITQADVLSLLEGVSLSGTRETAIRLRETLGRIWGFGVTQGVLEAGQNFMAKGVADFKLRSPRPKKMAAFVDIERVGQLIRNLNNYQGHFIVQSLLRIMPYLFQRPGQIRMMQWDQLDLERGLWICPPEIMKMRAANRPFAEAHVVPLPTQAIKILNELKPLTGASGRVFPSVSRTRRQDGTYGRYISENTVNAALRNMGYCTKTEITGHGFRALARTLIREKLGYDREIIERHLAHVSDEELGDTYDRARFVEQRKTMVQAWADYLDELAMQQQTTVLARAA